MLGFRQSPVWMGLYAVCSALCEYSEMRRLRGRSTSLANYLGFYNTAAGGKREIDEQYVGLTNYTLLPPPPPPHGVLFSVVPSNPVQNAINKACR